MVTGIGTGDGKMKMCWLSSAIENIITPELERRLLERGIEEYYIKEISVLTGIKGSAYKFDYIFERDGRYIVHVVCVTNPDLDADRKDYFILDSEFDTDGSFSCFIP